jgi:hypothetical protein
MMWVSSCTLEEAFVSRKDAKTQSFSMRYLCRTVRLPGAGVIVCKVLFFFAFLASLREQLRIPGSGRHPGT